MTSIWPRRSQGNTVLVALVLLFSALAGLLLFLWVMGNGDERGEFASAVNGQSELGHVLYEGNCMACHGGEGQGRTGDFPPLAGHVPEMLAREGGRTYLLDVVLHGVAGETEIQGVRYEGFMPGFDRLSDEEVAALLNYLSKAWNNESALPDDHQPWTPEEVAERREHERPAREVGADQPR